MPSFPLLETSSKNISWGIPIRLKPYSASNPKLKMQAASASVTISEMLCSYDHNISDFTYENAVGYKSYRLKDFGDVFWIVFQLSCWASVDFCEFEEKF